MTAAFALTACSGGSSGNAGTGTESSAADFDFEGNTPLGEVIPSESQQFAPAFEGELLDGTAKDDRQLAGAFVESVGAEYPSLFDPRGDVGLAFRGFPAHVVPSTILIDGAGRVAGVYVAVVPEEDLRRALDLLMDEQPPR